MTNVGHVAEQTRPILISGAGGLIGSALRPYLVARGHEVLALSRGSVSNAGNSIFWDPTGGVLDPGSLSGLSAVIHLGGEPIVGRWNENKKHLIRSSRVDATHLLARTLAKLPSPPETLLCASAIGIYGNRGDEVLDEQSSLGSGFLAEVGRDWEAATDPARQAGIRVVHLRFGVVLSTRGGALAKMLTPFKLGLGGRLGNGRQYMSWVGLDDVVGAIHHALTVIDLSGAVNVVSPQPVTNRQFTETLARVLSRPALFPAPALVLRLVLGEMAESLLLASTRVLPRSLEQSGYSFGQPDLENALRNILNK